MLHPAPFEKYLLQRNFLRWVRRFALQVQHKQCQATEIHSRCQDWNPATSGMKVCWTHGGARRKNRWDKDAPNFKHGMRSLETTTQTTQALQRLRVLAVGVRGMNGDRLAAERFTPGWEALQEQQAGELAALLEKTRKK